MRRNDKLVVIYLANRRVNRNFIAAMILRHAGKIDRLAAVGAGAGQKQHGGGHGVHPYGFVLFSDVVKTIDARARNLTAENSIGIFFDDKSSTQSYGNFCCSGGSIRIRLRDKFHCSGVLAGAFCEECMLGSRLCGVSGRWNVGSGLGFLS